MKAMVRFGRRAKVQITAVARRRIFQSEDGQYRVVENRYLVGRLPTVWHAMIRRREAWGWCWDLLGRHRTRRAAERHIEQLVRGQTANEAQPCRR